MSDVSYTRVNWEDSPSTKTPISNENLNKMDKGISDCATAINSANTSLTAKQPITDNTLDTTAKTVPGAINELNTDLSNKVERMSDVSGYQTVDVLGYNPTTKKLGLKVNGADTVIPFSNQLTSTTLWTNSEPTSSFSAQVITLNQSISNFDYVKMTFRRSTSDSSSISYIWSVADFRKLTYNTNWGFAAVFSAANTSSVSSRRTRYVSDTSINFDLQTRTSDVIPIGVYGLK